MCREETLGPTVEQVLRDMCFCEAVCSGAALREVPAFGASVGFSGPLSGEFRVAVSHRMAFRMSTDFLGLEYQEASMAQAEATVREFANIACCAVVSAWMPGELFRFSVPHELKKNQIASEFPYRFSVGSDEAELAIDIARE